MTPPNPPTIFPATHNTATYPRAKFTRDKPNYSDLLLDRRSDQYVPARSAMASSQTAAPSQLRDEDFISRYSELKSRLEMKNLSGVELSYIERLVLTKIQARFREYYRRSEQVDTLLIALAEHGRLFLDAK